jgi:hypothetical protein
MCMHAYEHSHKFFSLASIFANMLARGQKTSSQSSTTHMVRAVHDLYKIILLLKLPSNMPAIAEYVCDSSVDLY